MNKLVSNYIYNGMYKLLLILIPLITTPYLTRVLGSNALGIDSYVLSIITLVELFGALGINLYSNREIAYKRDDKEELTNLYYEIQTIRFSLGIIVIACYIFLVSRTQYRTYFLIQTLAIVGYFIDVTWLFVGCEEMKLPVIRNIIIKILQTILIFCLIKSRNDLNIYIWISAICNFVSSICMYPYVHKWIGKYNRKALKIKRHFKPVLALFLPQAASSIYVQFDRTMIGLLSSNISYVSIYDKAESLVKVPLQFVSATTTVMIPRISNEFAKGKMENISKLLKEELRFVLLFIIPMMAGMIVISDRLVLWYLGEQYIESGMVIKMLTPTLLTIGMGELFGSQILVSVNETRGMTVAFVTGAIANVIFNAMLIPKYNAAGAAVATTVAETLVIIVQCHYAKKYIGKIHIFEFFLRKLIAAEVMFIAIFKLSALNSSNWIMLVQVFVGAIIYFLCLAVCRDKELLDGWGILKNYYYNKMKNKNI